MRKIGQLRPLTNDPAAGLVGHISTLECDLTLQLEPTGAAADTPKPTYLVAARNTAGRLVNIGAAWLKTATRGETTGEPFLSLTLDDPSLQAPLNVAAFKETAGSGWVVTWRRRVKATSQTDGQ